MAKVGQSISFAALANKTFGDPAFTVYASASSGLEVAFAASGACTVAGSSVQIGGIGSCTLTASQPGDANYSPATPQSRTVTIYAATQTITFGPAPANVTVGQVLPPVSATSSSPTAAPSDDADHASVR